MVPCFVWVHAKPQTPKGMPISGWSLAYHRCFLEELGLKSIRPAIPRSGPPTTLGPLWGLKCCWVILQHVYTSHALLSKRKLIYIYVYIYVYIYGIDYSIRFCSVKLLPASIDDIDLSSTAWSSFLEYLGPPSRHLRFSSNHSPNQYWNVWDARARLLGYILRQIQV